MHKSIKLIQISIVWIKSIGLLRLHFIMRNEKTAREKEADPCSDHREGSDATVAFLVGQPLLKYVTKEPTAAFDACNHKLELLAAFRTGKRGCLMSQISTKVYPNILKLKHPHRSNMDDVSGRRILKKVGTFCRSFFSNCNVERRKLIKIVDQN